MTNDFPTCSNPDCDGEACLQAANDYVWEASTDLVCRLRAFADDCCSPTMAALLRGLSENVHLELFHYHARLLRGPADGQR